MNQEGLEKRLENKSTQTHIGEQQYHIHTGLHMETQSRPTRHDIQPHIVVLPDSGRMQREGPAHIAPKLPRAHGAPARGDGNSADWARGRSVLPVQEDVGVWGETATHSDVGLVPTCMYFVWIKYCSYVVKTCNLFYVFYSRIDFFCNRGCL